MNKKKLTMLFSSIGIVSVVGLVCLFNSGIGTSTNISDSNQALNTRIESKEEIVVNNKLSEILEKSILKETLNEPIEIDNFIEQINTISEIKEEIKNNTDVENIKTIEKKIDNIVLPIVNDQSDNDSEIITPIEIDNEKEEIIKEENTQIEKTKESEETTERIVSESIPKITEKDTKEVDVKENNIEEKPVEIPEEELKETIQTNIIEENNLKEKEIESIQEKEELILQPETPLIKNKENSTNSISINFNKTINTEKYKCYYGINNSMLNNEGTIIEVVNGMQCSINNLKDGEKYYIQIESINKDKISRSEIVEVYTEYKTPTKQNIINNVVTDSSIKATYTKAKNANRYVCYYKEKASSNWNTISNIVTDDSNIYCEINGLKENSIYDLKIEAINGNKSTESDVSTFTTEFSKPSIPVIKHINVDKNNAQIIFNKSTNASSYLCRYGLTENSLNMFGNTVISNNEVVCQLNNLNPNTSYFIEILAYNHTVSNKLNIFKITTNQLVELSTPVLIESQSNANEINAAFNIYTGNPEEFSCLYGIDKNNLNLKGTITNQTNSMAECRLSNLKEGNSYFVKLIASNQDFTKESEIYELKTDFVSPTKSKLNSIETTPNNAEVLFEKTFNTKEYQCYYGESNSNLNLKGTIVETNDLIQCNLENLNENSNYYVKLNSINGDKITSSDVYNIKTKNITPEKPEILNIQNSISSIKVDFKLSKYAKGYKGYFGMNDKNFTEVPVTLKDNFIEINKNSLQENTEYYFKLIAINGDKEVESDIINVKTLERELSKPTLINSSSTDSIITINYNAEDDLDLYMCYYGTDSKNLTNSVNAIKTKANTRQCVLNNLDENTTYYFKLMTTKNGKVSESEINNKTTQYSTPTIPTKTTESVTNNSLSVNYEINSSITDYTCKIGTDSNNLNTKINGIRNGNTINCSANNLLDKTTYFVKLEVVNGDKTNSSAINSISTLFDTPTKPLFKSEKIEKNSLEAVYSTSDNATDYICYYGDDIASLNKIGTVEIKNNQVICNFNNLEEGHKYFYKLTATNHNEIFTNSDIKLANIPYSNPDKAILKDISSSTNSAIATFTVNSNYTYTCQFGRDINDITYNGTVNLGVGNTAKCEMNNLQEGTEYYFKMTAINGNKKVDSDISTVTTTVKVDNNVLAKPQFVNNPPTFGNNITVNYTKVDGAYAHYCYYGTDENLSYKTTASYVDGYAQCHLENIDLSEDLYVKMRAYKKDGVTYSESDIMTIEANKYIPEKPVLTDVTKDFENIITTYNTGGYIKKMECSASTDNKNFNIKGTFASHGTTELCGFTNLNPNTTYYIKLDNIFDKETTSSDVKIIKTDALNNCMGGGPNTSNLGDYLTRVNSTCAVDEKSSLVENSMNVARKLVAIDTLKVLKDYPAYDVASLGEINYLYNADRTVSGVYANIILYRPGNMADVVGEYNLQRNLNRVWVKELP